MNEHYSYESNLDIIKRELAAREQVKETSMSKEAKEDFTKKEKKPEVKQILFTIAFLATAFLIIWFALKYAGDFSPPAPETFKDTTPIELHMSPEEFGPLPNTDKENQ